MPYYAPARPPSSALYDTRLGLPAADYYKLPQEPELYGYKEGTGTSFTHTGIRTGAILSNGTIVIRQNTNTNTYKFDTNTFVQSGGPTAYSHGGRVMASYNDTAFFYGDYRSGRVDFYNVNTGSWETNAPYWLGEIRYLSSMFQVNGNLYCVGGTARYSYGYGADANTLYFLPAASYPLVNDTTNNPPGWVSPWTALSPPPDAMCSPVGCVSYDQKSIHIFHYQNGAGDQIDNWYEYVIAADTWINHGVSIGIQNNAIQLSTGGFVGFGSNAGILLYSDGVETQSSSLQSYTGISMLGDLLYDPSADTAYLITQTPAGRCAKLNPFLQWAVNYAR